MPRPEPRSRLSGARGSGRVAGSSPGPWSAMRMTSDSPVFSKDAVMRLSGLVGVAVKDGVDGSFAGRHGDTEHLIFVESSLSGHLLGGLFHAVHAVEGGIERIGNAACLGSGHSHSSSVLGCCRRALRRAAARVSAVCFASYRYVKDRSSLKLSWAMTEGRISAHLSYDRHIGKRLRETIVRGSRVSSRRAQIEPGR